MFAPCAVSVDVLVGIILLGSLGIGLLVNWLIRNPLVAYPVSVALIAPFAILVYSFPRLLGSGLDGFLDDVKNILAWFVAVFFAAFVSVFLTLIPLFIRLVRRSKPSD